MTLPLKHWYLIAYDVRDRTRLRKVHYYLRKQALAVQKSVFIIHTDLQTLAEVEAQLRQRVVERDDDLRLYAKTLDEILGVEGQVAHAWFGLIAQVLNPAWKFTGRNRRPPRDPVNALLSLGYTLLGAEVHQGVMALGLDPSLGFLHQPVPGRESMVLDLTEVFRGGVDHFVLGWIDPAGPQQADCFYRDEDGCRLSKAARPGFYGAWADYRNQWPYPLGDATEEQWPRGTLREQVHGWIERLRREMKAIGPM